MSETVKREKKGIIISENRDFKGVWIPERLYLTREFTPNEKFLLIEIYSLTKKKNRECFANNKHFADFVGLKENTVQKMMLKFENAGYIKRNYEYREGTKEIDRRTIKLTQKFYDDFINETENADSSADGMENNQEGYGMESTDPIDKNPQGDGLKVGDKYNNFKSNNDLRDIDLSNTKAETLSNDNGEVKTSFSEKSKKDVHTKTALEKYLGKKADEQDMMKRLANICISNYDEETAKEIFETIEHYFRRYTDKTGLIHPILKDETLIRITEKMDCFYDSEYSHFERLIGQDHAFMKMVDMFFDGDFGANKGNETNYHLPAFMTDGILNRLGQRLFELGEVEE